jgi:hypothetical protein
VVLDAVSGVASAGTGAITNRVFAASMVLALAGALGGGVLAARRNHSASGRPWAAPRQPQ